METIDSKDQLNLAELKFLLPLVSEVTVKVSEAGFAVALLNKLARLLDNAE